MPHADTGSAKSGSLASTVQHLTYKSTLPVSRGRSHSFQNRSSKFLAHHPNGYVINHLKGLIDYLGRQDSLTLLKCSIGAQKTVNIPLLAVFLKTLTNAILLAVKSLSSLTRRRTVQDHTTDGGKWRTVIMSPCNMFQCR